MGLASPGTYPASSTRSRATCATCRNGFSTACRRATAKPRKSRISRARRPARLEHRPATWATFEAAVAAHERGRGDGLGFVFTPTTRSPGSTSTRACATACSTSTPADRRALDTYTELSPSGVGLHVIGRAQVGGGRRTSKTPWGGELEVYDRDRYFTVTGRGSRHARP
jgi:primase-polymerase (primpol)-like protein